jgi:hypothetical protein
MERKYVLEQKHPYRSLSRLDKVQPWIILVAALVIVGWAYVDLRASNEPPYIPPPRIVVNNIVPTEVPTQTPTPDPWATATPTVTPTATAAVWESLPLCTDVPEGTDCQMPINTWVDTSLAPPTPTLLACPVFHGSDPSMYGAGELPLACRKVLTTATPQATESAPTSAPIPEAPKEVP